MFCAAENYLFLIGAFGIKSHGLDETGFSGF
jgi:hypothetical protein